MKRGTPSHIKTERLARALDVRRHSAVGLLELLWHVTAETAPDGGIGRLTDEEIARRLDWPEDDAGRLIDALIQTQWIDRVRRKSVRLYVHDYHEHAEDSIQMRLARAGRRFANNVPPKLTRLKGSEKAEAADKLGIELKPQSLGKSKKTTARKVCAQRAHGERTADAVAEADALAVAIADTETPTVTLTDTESSHVKGTAAQWQRWKSWSRCREKGDIYSMTARSLATAVAELEDDPEKLLPVWQKWIRELDGVGALDHFRAELEKVHTFLRHDEASGIAPIDHPPKFLNSKRAELLQSFRPPRPSGAGASASRDGVGLGTRTGSGSDRGSRSQINGRHR